MRPEKLMIGDWVSLFQGNPDGSSCNVQVSYIGEYGEVGIAGCKEYTSANCNLLFPIPLTPEILERNGFVKNKYGEIILDEELGTSEIYLVLEPTWDEEYYWWRVNNELITKIKSVHELQHVLRLCGINKNIVI